MGKVTALVDNHSVIILIMTFGHALDKIKKEKSRISGLMRGVWWISDTSMHSVMWLLVEMDVKLQRYYKINKFLLTLIGQWPYQSTSGKWSFLILSVFLCSCQMAPQITAAIIHRRDPEILIECISPFLLDIICLGKLANCMVKSNKVGCESSMWKWVVLPNFLIHRLNCLFVDRSWWTMTR